MYYKRVTLTSFVNIKSDAKVSILGFFYEVCFVYNTRVSLTSFVNIKSDAEVSMSSVT